MGPTALEWLKQGTDVRSLPLLGDARRSSPQTPLPRAQSADYRVFRSPVGAHVFVANGSRIYDLDDADALSLEGMLRSDDPAGSVHADKIGDALGLARRRFIEATPLPPPPVHSLSLNVAQACNMACHYCGSSGFSVGLDWQLEGRRLA